MEDFATILQDYGLKPQGKMAPMANAKQPAFSTKPAAAGSPRNGTHQRSSTSILSDDDPFFAGNAVRSSASGRHNTYSGSDPLLSHYDDLFRAPSPGSSSTHIFEDIFKPASQKSASVSSSKGPSSYPVFDAPVYDDDIFGGMPGIRSVDSAFEDVFNIGSVPAAPPTKSSISYDDLLGGLGTSNAKQTETKTKPINQLSSATSAGEFAFEELLSGFGTAETSKPQSSEDGKPSQRKNSEPGKGLSANILEDPFAVLDSDNVGHTNLSRSASNTGFFEATVGGSDGSSRNVDKDCSSTGSVNLENNPLHPSQDEVSAPPEPFLPRQTKSGVTQSPSSISAHGDSSDVLYSTGPPVDDTVVKEHRKATLSRAKVDSSIPTSSADSASTGSPSHRNRATQSGETENLFKRSRQTYRESTFSPSRGREEAPSQSPKVGRSGRADEFWLSIDDVKLVTQPTAAPPPVRPPPMPGSRQGHANRKSPSEGRSIANGGHSPVNSHAKDGFGSAKPGLDDFEVFASGNLRKMDADVKDFGATSPGEEEQGSAAATASGAAMREAIERAEAKLRQAKEAKDRDREEAKGTRNKEGTPARERDEGESKALHDREEQDREEREREARERWRKEREREEREREKQREREREREKDRASEIARQRAAVERANTEVREREAQRAVERAVEARMKVERAAVERATAEARERLERAAVEKARAERAAAAEREKVEKDKMAASGEQLRKTEDDLESFFRSSSRPASAPKQRTHPTDGFPTAQPSNEGLWRNSRGSAANVKKTPSMPSMADDWTSLFGEPSLSPGTFREIEGEPADRRKSRWERHQRTLERAARALEEKHQRDLQSAKEQEDRHRAGELVDAEIKRWAAGKEGNLRALLSTLQYVLWPDCGWQPVSLTDLITAAAVKKVYRKATLCVHPDKVQQKGATNQQKYIAEKVFDLLKEAWNKFNSQELF